MSKAATTILNILPDANYAPWWREIIAAGTGITVTVDDPNQLEESGHTITQTLTAAHVHKAIRAAQPQLCCADEMKDSYGNGCGEDANQILQHALFGKTIYG